MDSYCLQTNRKLVYKNLFWDSKTMTINKAFYYEVPNSDIWLFKFINFDNVN